MHNAPTLFLLAVVLAPAIVSCSGDLSEPPSTNEPIQPGRVVSSIEISSSRDSMFIGESLQLRAILRDQSGREMVGSSPVWASADPSAASVTTTGLVTALRVGSVGISASLMDKSSTRNLRIVNATNVALASTTMYVGALAELYPGGPVQSEILSVSPTTGSIVNLTKHEADDRLPTLSHNREYLAFSSKRNWPFGSPHSEVLLMRIDGSDVTRLPYKCSASTPTFLRCTVSTSWLPDGRLRYFVRDDNPIPTFFGLAELAPLNGAPTNVNNSAAIIDRLRSGWIDSPTGVFSAAYSSEGLRLRNLADGGITMIAPACGSGCWGIKWAGDGRRLYTHRLGVIQEYDVQNTTVRSLYTGRFEIREFELSPDDQLIAFIEDGDVKIVPVTGGNTRTIFQSFFEFGAFRYSAWSTLTWSRDSKSLAFVGGRNVPSDLLAANANGTGWKKFDGVNYPDGIAW